MLLGCYTMGTVTRQVNNSNKHKWTKKEEKKMAVLEKPINRVSVIKSEDSPKFIQEFNKNKVSKEFLNTCKKAGDLFAGRK